MKRYAIIVAGGLGTRMGSKTPKQFLLIEDKPIIVETILKFHHFDPTIHFVVVLPENHLSRWREVENTYLKEYSIEITKGGETRSDSVREGLSLIEGNGLVAIHDAVRPYVSREVIERSFLSAEKNGSGVACVPLKDSIREIIDKDSRARNRSDFVLVQTPQTFRVDLIKEAYEAVSEPQSDDATVYEMSGKKIHLVDGEYSNIKITTPEDLQTF